MCSIRDIFRLPDMKVTVKATVESVCVVNGEIRGQRSI